VPQTQYLTPEDLPGQPRRLYSYAGQQWRLAAVIVHFTRSGIETGRTAFLRRMHGGGREWEIPWESLDAVVDE